MVPSERQRSALARADEVVQRQGHTVAFPEGPEGAHQVLNRTDEPVRVLILSTKGPFPTVAVYPDSDKLGVWLADGYQGIFRRGDAVDYWEGEG